MARIFQYIEIFFFFHLLLVSSSLLCVTIARPFTKVQRTTIHFHDSGPSPGIGHHDYEEHFDKAIGDNFEVDAQHFDKAIDDNFEVDAVHSGPSPGEGHK